MLIGADILTSFHNIEKKTMIKQMWDIHIIDITQP